MRTVRAFAMEEQEKDLFDEEAQIAMYLNQTLGFGIGMFQAGTNLFLNGYANLSNLSVYMILF